MTTTESRAVPVVTVIPALDGLRAVAASLVVLTHAAFLTGFGATGGLLGRLWSRGDFGVAIFFALSGFLLHRGLIAADAAGRLDLFGYAVRRAARLLPAYWVVLAVVAVGATPPLRDVVIHAFALQIYWPDAWIGAFGQSWSIATEVAFYATLPLLVLGLRRLRSRGTHVPLTVLCVLTVGLTATSGIGGDAVVGQDIFYDRWLHSRAPHFLIGMICAETLLAPGHRLARLLARWGGDVVACLAVAGGAYLLATTPIAGGLDLSPGTPMDVVVRTALSGIVALGLLLPLTHGGSSGYRAALSHHMVRYLGVISYGLFLWHVPVFIALYAVTGVREFTGALLPLMALGLPLSLVLAAATHHWVELPSSRLAGRYLAGRRHREAERREHEHSDAPLHR
ncbi:MULTISPECIES: acyltransferase family protein [unclassified Knoellia]|uniref:acyltransferase family protein n=1 Tax=Knoellia altitudinis TaxID=3404795 RepID=UPI003607BA1D